MAVSPLLQNGCDEDGGSGGSSDEEKHPSNTETPVSLKRVISDSKDGQTEVGAKKPKITIEPVKTAGMALCYSLVCLDYNYQYILLQPIVRALHRRVHLLFTSHQ